jgi:hypothetical protein
MKKIKREGPTGVITSHFIGFKKEDPIIQALAEATDMCSGLEIWSGVEVLLNHCPEGVIPMVPQPNHVIFYDLRFALKK